MSLQLFIAEDEPPALARLQEAIGRVAPDARIVGHADTVQGTAAWLACHAAPDLLLMDIQLADGLSLELFEQRACPAPVVFITAYDRFALQAFRSLALDYLLKPVSDDALARAFGKMAELRQHLAPDAARLAAAMDALRSGVGAAVGRPRQRLVGRPIGSSAGQSQVLAVERLAYLVALDKAAVAVTSDGQRHAIDQALTELEALLDPRYFFRANRQLLVAAAAVRGFGPAGRGRLQLQLAPDPGFEAVVSQERAAAFRHWLEQ